MQTKLNTDMSIFKEATDNIHDNTAPYVLQYVLSMFFQTKSVKSLMLTYGKRSRKDVRLMSLETKRITHSPEGLC